VLNKEQILIEIRRTASANGGNALGSRKFEAETGLKTYDWLGKFWARWSDALAEAGFAPNQLQGAYDTVALLQMYVGLARELGRLPTANDLRLKDRKDPTFPNQKVFERLGTKQELIQQVLKYAREQTALDDVIAMCEAYTPRSAQVAEGHVVQEMLGYVYLVQHGARREYKIGRTNNALRREGEIAVELPEKVRPIHVIATDDPVGIEAYWHRRFADEDSCDGRCTNSDHTLDACDVRADSVIRKRVVYSHASGCGQTHGTEHRAWDPF
jgi:hypothetical protein